MGGLEDSAQVAAASIPVEKIQDLILLLCPMDDQVWPSGLMGDMIAERLQVHDFAYPFEHIRYEDAGHMLMAQYHKSLTEQKGQMPIGDKRYSFDFGGTP